MTKDDIIRMAREAGLLPILNEDAFQKWEWEKTNKVLERFAALVAAAEAERISNQSRHIIKRAEARGAEAERKRCAKVCDKHWDDNGQHCANAIRAMGDK